jgi:hypothetical protein
MYIYYIYVQIKGFIYNCRRLFVLKTRKKKGETRMLSLLLP